MRKFYIKILCDLLKLGICHDNIIGLNNIIFHNYFIATTQNVSSRSANLTTL